MIDQFLIPLLKIVVVLNATLVAVTPCRMASVDASQFDRSALVELSGGHRREDADRG